MSKITYNTPGAFTWIAQATSATIECWGGGGAGGNTTTASGLVGGGGGGGGAYSSKVVTGLTVGATYDLYVGQSGAPGASVNGETSWFYHASSGTNRVAAAGGTGAILQLGGVGGTATDGDGTIKYSGGNGGLGGFIGDGSISGDVYYKLWAGEMGQVKGVSQFNYVSPFTGPSSFQVMESGALIGSEPSMDAGTARAWTGDWGLAVQNPAYGTDVGVTGHVELNGSEYLRLTFPLSFRPTIVKFTSAGLSDRIALLADGVAVNLFAMFGTDVIRTISSAQGGWPGAINFTMGVGSLPAAKVWEFRTPGGLANSVQVADVYGDITYNDGGGGGSSAGTAANGTAGTDIGGIAPTGGGNGGNGGVLNGFVGVEPGGGGGGGGAGSLNNGANGANGQVIITFTLPVAGASLTPSIICFDQLMTLDGSTSIDVDGTIVRWKWYVNSTTSETNLLADVTTSTTVISYSTIKAITEIDDVFNIYLIVQDNLGNWSTDSDPIEIRLYIHYICSGGIDIFGTSQATLHIDADSKGGGGGSGGEGEGEGEGQDYASSGQLKLNSNITTSLFLQHTVLGGITISRTSQADWYAHYVSSGNIKLDGNTTTSLSYHYIVLGEIIISRTSQVDWYAHYVSSGAIKLDGSIIASLFFHYIVSGGITIAGRSRVEWGLSCGGVISLENTWNAYTDSNWYGFTDSLWSEFRDRFIVFATLHIPYDQDVILIVTPTSEFGVYHYEWVTEGGITLTPDATLGYYYIPETIIGVHGDSIIGWVSAYNTTGSVIIGVQANTIVLWATHYESTAGIIIGIVAESIITLHLYYTPAVTLNITPEARYDLNLTYDLTAYIDLTLEAAATLGISYSGKTNIGLEANHELHIHYPYVPSIALLIDGTALVWTNCTYEGTVPLEFTPVAQYESRFTYDPTAHINLAPEATATQGISYSGNTSINLEANHELNLHYLFNASITLLIDGTTLVWVNHDYEGTVPLEITPVADVIFGTAYDPIGNIIISCEHDATWHTDYQPEISILISPEGTATWYTDYLGNVPLNVTPAAEYLTSREYIGEVVLRLEGQALIHFFFETNVLIDIEPSSNQTFALSVNAEGIIQLSGSSEIEERKYYAGNVLITVTPTSTIESLSYNYIPIGGIVFEYDKDWYKFVDPEWNQFTEQEWRIFRDYAFGAICTLHIPFDSTGEIIVINGESSMDIHYLYTGDVVIIIEGSSDIHHHYVVIGGVIIGLYANVRIDWATSWSADGHIIIGINAASIIQIFYSNYDGSGTIYIEGSAEVWGSVPYDPTGGITLDGNSQVDWGTSYDATGSILIESITRIDWGASYDITGTILMDGQATCELWLSHDGLVPIYISGEVGLQIHYLFAAFGSILIEGASQADWGTSYDSLGGIFIEGTSQIDWGTSYDPLSGIVLGGTSPAGTGATYVVVGGIIIGVSANATTDWGTSYNGAGIIIVGGDVHWHIHYHFNPNGFIIILTPCAEAHVGGIEEDMFNPHFGLWRLNRVVASHITNFRKTMHREDYERVGSNRGRIRIG